MAEAFLSKTGRFVLSGRTIYGQEIFITSTEVADRLRLLFSVTRQRSASPKRLPQRRDIMKRLIIDIAVVHVDGVQISSATF